MEITIEIKGRVNATDTPVTAYLCIYGDHVIDLPLHGWIQRRINEVMTRTFEAEKEAIEKERKCRAEFPIP